MRICGFLIVFLVSAAIAEDPNGTTTETATNNETPSTAAPVTSPATSTEANSPATTTTAPSSTTPITTPTASTAASTTAPASTTLKTATNPQAQRDVAQPGNCSSTYQELKKTGNWIPEKVFLNNLEGKTNVADFCNQTMPLMDLNKICSNMSDAVVESNGIKVAPIAAGLAATFTSLCKTPTLLKVVSTDGTKCNNQVMENTKTCTSSLKLISVSYPSEAIYNLLMTTNCPLLKDLKTCLAASIGATSSVCSKDEQTAIFSMMDAVMEDNPCKASPTVATTTSAPKSSATRFELNYIVLVLPALLAFKLF